MKKRVGVLTLVLALLCGPAFALTDTAVVTTSATVSSVFDITLNIFEFENNSINNNVTTMNFGNLGVVNGTLNSVNSGTAAFVVFASATANSSTLTGPYTVKLTGTPMTRTGGSETLPNASLVFDPEYNPADNGGAANDGGAMTGPASWVGTDLAVYTSSAGRPTRTVQVYHSIQNVSTGQVAGIYTGTITYTLTAS